MPDDFTITWREDRPHGRELVVAGELDAFTAIALKEALDGVAGNGTMVVVDAAAISFIDSTGLQALLNGGRRIQALGGCLYLANPSPVVMRLLELTGLSDHFADPSATPRTLGPHTSARANTSPHG